MDELYQQVANVGFPIVVAFYLLIRIEGKLSTLSDSINNLSINIEKLDKS
ncbi:MAG: YvrJ family protein [Paraclostridium sp.]